MERRVSIGATTIVRHQGTPSSVRRSERGGAYDADPFHTDGMRGADGYGGTGQVRSGSYDDDGLSGRDAFLGDGDGDGDGDGGIEEMRMRRQQATAGSERTAGSIRSIRTIGSMATSRGGGGGAGGDESVGASPMSAAGPGKFRFGTNAAQFGNQDDN